MKASQGVYFRNLNLYLEVLIIRVKTLVPLSHQSADGLLIENCGNWCRMFLTASFTSKSDEKCRPFERFSSSLNTEIAR